MPYCSTYAATYHNGGVGGGAGVCVARRGARSGQHARRAIAVDIPGVGGRKLSPVFTNARDGQGIPMVRAGILERRAASVGAEMERSSVGKRAGAAGGGTTI